MGFHVTQSRDAERAPEYFFNHAGFPTWCGRSVLELSGQQCIEMLKFCRSEGYRQGWVESWDEMVHAAEEGAEQTCMFHSDFAGGIPHLLWCESYTKGHQVAAEEKSRQYPLRVGGLPALEAAFESFRGQSVAALYKTAHGTLRHVDLTVSPDGAISETYGSRVVVSADGRLGGTPLAAAVAVGAVHLRGNTAPDDAGADE